MRLLTLLSGTLVLAAGCASISEDSVIPTDGRTMLNIYRSASADEPVSQDATIRAMNENCQSGSKPDSVKRCIELLKQAQREQAGSPELEIEDETYVGVSEPMPLAQPKQPEQAAHNTHLRHPEALNPDYTRSSSNEVRVLFPRLPNPDIEIYVFPHLATANNVPVPGYSTVMPLYNSVQYAMPGESRSIDSME